MARGREDERALSARRGPSGTTAALASTGPAGTEASPGRANRLSRIGLLCVAALVLLGVVGSACPGIESVPSPGAAPVSGPREEHLVRIAAPAGPGAAPARLVYDKETRWVSAKCAELFPRVAVRLVPADYVETPAGLVPAAQRSRPPLWR